LTLTATNQKVGSSNLSGRTILLCSVYPGSKSSSNLELVAALCDRATSLLPARLAAGTHQRRRDLPILPVSCSRFRTDRPFTFLQTPLLAREVVARPEQERVG